MKLKAALLATATAGAFLLVPACGGDGERSQPDSANGSTQSQSGTASGTTQSPPVAGSGSSTSAQYVAIDLGIGVGYGIGDGEQVGVSSGAVLWRGSASSAVELAKSGKSERFAFSTALATSAGVQVGWGYVSEDFKHALKWTGTADSVVDLNPSGCRHSKASGIWGDQVVGECWLRPDWGNLISHALLWTSRGVVDLHPSGFSESIASATDGTQQVGNGGKFDGGYSNSHALLWRGTADSVVDLHPASGYSFTVAYGVSDGQQVGWGGGFGSERALLWKGSAESVVDLHPSGFRTTVAQGVAGGQQAGWGTTADGSTRALLWTGTVESVVNLHAFLPAGFTQSRANGIDASGNVIGTALDAERWHAILWMRQ